MAYMIEDGGNRYLIGNPMSKREIESLQKANVLPAILPKDKVVLKFEDADIRTLFAKKMQILAEKLTEIAFDDYLPEQNPYDD